MPQWFRRGWTLQELIAPKEVWFYQDWKFPGPRSTLSYRISCITNIDEKILQNNSLDHLHSYSVATRLSWAAGRLTTRPEDRAYSLMGLFGINMPTLYGEGEQSAFFRLQMKIFWVFADHSILAWEPRFNNPKLGHPEIDLFARSPDAFTHATTVERAAYEDFHLDSNLQLNGETMKQAPYSIFSHSMRIQLLMRPNEEFLSGRPVYEACLACVGKRDKRPFSIYLIETSAGQFKRLVSWEPGSKDLKQVNIDSI